MQIWNYLLEHYGVNVMFERSLKLIMVTITNEVKQKIIQQADIVDSTNYQLDLL